MKTKLFAVLLFVQSSLAIGSPPARDVMDGLSLGPEEFKTLTVESIYPYKIMRYVSSPPISQIKRGDAKYGTPEDALIANLSSLVAADFKWNNETWDAESAREMAVRDESGGRDATQWERLWQKLYGGVRFVLNKRIEYGRFVLIEYTVSYPNNSRSSFKETAVLSKKSGDWRLTQALSSDPIVDNWNKSDGRVRVAPESLFNK